jgi:hypothetical protein
VNIHGRYQRWFGVLCLIFSQTLAFLAPAITVDQLRQDSQLTPQKFAKHFSRFRFEARAAVQHPEDFLASQAGDCDDYATLAAAIFTEKGFHTKLVLVRMQDQVHMVCCVMEAGCYLDYNNRGYVSRTVETNGSVEDIAKKVARSFGERWLAASEFEGNLSAGQTGRTVTARGYEAMAGVRTERSSAPAQQARIAPAAPRQALPAEPVLAIVSRN